MSTTLLALERLIAKELGYATGSPSTGGASDGTTLVDTSGDSPLDTEDAAKLYQNAWLKIEADSNPTPQNVGEVRRIKTYSPASGTLTVSRAFPNPTTGTMTYGVYFGVPPTRLGMLRGLDEFIGDVLPYLYYRYPVLLSLLADADMEASGVTNWSQVGTCARAKSTATGVTYGKQSLSCTNAAINSGAKNAVTVPVIEGETYQVCADLRCDGYTGVLKLYDVTNAATIDVVKQTAERGQRFLYNQVTIPTDCKQLEVHLLGSEGAAVHYWDNVSLRRAYATEMGLPSWVSRPDLFEWLYYTYGGQMEKDNDSYNVDMRQWYPVHNCGVVEDPAGVGLKVWWEGTQVPAAAHLWAVCRRPGAALSADTDTTEVPADLVKAAALAAIYGSPAHYDAQRFAFWMAERNRLERSLGGRSHARGYPVLRRF